MESLDFELLTNSKREQLSQQLDNILSAELSPENINTYASDALSGVVQIAEDVREHYESTCATWDGNTEDQAFDKNGLGNIDHILSHISTVADTIDNLGLFVSRLYTENTILLPPDDISWPKNFRTIARLF